jgi:hypothetical protein
MPRPGAKPNRDNEAADRKDDLTCYDEICWSGLDNAPDTPANTPRGQRLTRKYNLASSTSLRTLLRRFEFLDRGKIIYLKC